MTRVENQHSKMMWQE